MCESGDRKGWVVRQEGRIMREREKGREGRRSEKRKEGVGEEGKEGVGEEGRCLELWEEDIVRDKNRDPSGTVYFVPGTGVSRMSDHSPDTTWENIVTVYHFPVTLCKFVPFPVPPHRHSKVDLHPFGETPSLEPVSGPTSR